MSRIAPAATLLLTAVLVAACSGGGGASSSPAGGASAPASASEAPSAAASEEPSASASESAAASAEASESAGASGAASVMVATSPLGQIVVDGAGMTLYVFTNDTNGESTCYGDCAAAWPPLTTVGPVTATGLDAADFGTTTRTDGTEQVTFFDQPLYHFAADKAAGDTDGQGVGGIWFVVDPAGKAIEQ
jgi:predicted lipoprotein with Yx(FWY)xxD motif